MSNFHIPDYLNLGASENTCRDTVNGWLWYCDVHDSHGIADGADEAWACADAHEIYKIRVEGRSADGCDIQVWQRTSHERVE